MSANGLLDAADAVHGLSYVHRTGAGSFGGRDATLVILHGFGKHSHHLFDLAADFDRRLSLVGLRAPMRIGPGAYRWFDYERSSDGTVVIDEDEESLSFKALISFLEACHSRGGDRGIYLLGHSQGAMMSLSAALSRPDLVDGCAVLNGRIHSQALLRMAARSSISAMPFFVGHGVQDTTIAVEQGRATRDRLAALGVELEYREYPSGHDVTPEMLSDVSDWLTRRLGSAPVGSNPARHALSLPK